MDLIDCSCLRVKLGPKLVKVGGIEGISDWPDYTVGSNITQIHLLSDPSDCGFFAYKARSGVNQGVVQQLRKC